ncbi:hypothetical protein [Persicitalea jodogahamensis]|uniref:Uncharacterized protein n=1 Tax=Persicitalea jodogahamensis TaxID=402147 RepID=A0A8J3G8H4_9BACT|nr:hypothetical protein [Persicitalea jodogahamensis]GHB65754.1 hypothetical protein GCM10007390_19840 [Persicitalea jodogahamensis]
MKHSKNFYLSLLLAGMALGTAWAIRGQFGHEQGAAWAGGIGALAIILLARRPDWYPKALKAALAGAIGWGLGGMISYGVVVGYGRGSDFGNVYYGLMMLFVIGSLFGFLGGGLFGLVLEESEEEPVAWPGLMAEMVTMAIVVYFFVVEQLGYLMTPPRSELWAACLGLAIGLAWYLVRSGRAASLRVAVYAGLGGGFGFAFGNFLHVLGIASEISFNFWNVMEYSIGFFGGAGMAYGTFTANWQQSTHAKAPTRSWFPITMLVLVIPLIVWDQSFGTERVQKMVESIHPANAEALITLTQALPLLAIMGAGLYWYFTFHSRKESDALTFKPLYFFFIAHFALYAFCSWLITGAFLSTYRIEQYLYLINLIVIGFLVKKVGADFRPKENHPRQWASLFGVVLIVMALAAFIAINSHEVWEKAATRF